jgi:hypothetical protein
MREDGRTSRTEHRLLSLKEQLDEVMGVHDHGLFVCHSHYMQMSVCLSQEAGQTVHRQGQTGESRGRLALSTARQFG